MQKSLSSDGLHHPGKGIFSVSFAFAVQEAGEEAAMPLLAGGGLLRLRLVLINKLLTARANLPAFRYNLTAHDAALFCKTGHTHICLL